MNWIYTIGIALANNLDNTGVGVAYGVARIKLPFLVNVWISIVTFIITAAAAAFGSGISRYLPGSAARYVSAFILCIIGLFVIAPALKQRKAPELQKANSVQKILVDPLAADHDNSRHIDLKEGTLLGIALSINNIGGGISAGLFHLSVFWTALLSAIISFLALWLGGLLGRRIAGDRAGTIAAVVAGALLIAIGLYQLR